MKSNISFYTHDADSHNHWKFKTLRRKYGWAGEGRFWALNNMIAEAPTCFLDIAGTNKKKAVAAELDFTLAEFEEYLEFISNECELIQIVDGCLCTKRTQEDLMRVNKKRENDRDQKTLKNVQLSQENGSEPETKQQLSLTKQQLSVAKQSLSLPENEQIRLDKNRVDTNTEENITCVEKNSEACAVAPSKKNNDKIKEAEKKQTDCLKRRENFKMELRELKETYPTDMLNAFYKYWSELNKSKTKMRWEMQQTWELKLRLYKWERNSYKFKNTENGKDTKTGVAGNSLKVRRNNTYSK